MFKLAQYLKYYKKEALIGASLKWLEALIGLFVPLVIAYLIDYGIAEGNRSIIIYSGLALLFLAILGLICALICQYLASKAAQGVGTILREKIFNKINTLSHSDIDEIGKSSLITRATNDIYNIEKGIALLIRLLVRSPFIVIGAMIMAFIVNAKLALIFVVIIPIISFILYKITKTTGLLYKNIQQRLERISLLTSENLSGARVIRAFNKQNYEKEKLENANQDFKRYSERAGKINSLLSPLTTIVLNLGIVAILYFGALLVGNDEMTQGQIVANINYMTEIILQMVIVSLLAVVFTRGRESAIRVNEILDYEISILDNNSLVADLNDKSLPVIEFDNVCFAYPKSKEFALKAINFSIFKGEKIGVIGSTGSGKSTLVSLIPRFYEANVGNVYVGNNDVCDINLASLRDNISFNSQHVAIFSGSIRENVLWGNEKASDDEVIEALRVSQAYEFVSKYKDNIEHKCMHSGRNFSGGQKQRIALARAIIKRAPIIILDDSTTALDYKTNRDFFEALINYLPESTIIAVSQRIRSLMKMDKIIVLEEGEIEGFGTHAELLEWCDVYKEIAYSQLSEEDNL